VVIQSHSSLDVTAVYTSTGVDERGEVTTHSSIDVEQIRERSTTPPKPPEPKPPDLRVRDIGRPQVTCPGGSGTCVTTVSITIANVGAGNAGAFNVRIVFDPAQSVVVNQPFTDLAAGAAVTFTATTPRGGNCFDPDCTICVTVDSDNTVEESDEGNNVLCETTPG
jgi:hypothetical protein